MDEKIAISYTSVDVSVSLMSYNQRRDLEKLLPSLLPAAELVQAEILLVNNRSTDGTSDFIQQYLPKIDILLNSRKAGYGENHNLNLKRARCRYFVIMNSDMTIAPNTFAILRDYLDQHPDIGIVSPKVLNEDGTIQGLNKRYPTLFDLLIRYLLPKFLQRIFKRRLDYYEMRDVGYDHFYDVPFLSGAFMFCRTDLLKSLDGFDPGYFLYFEDVDLCRRVQRTHRTVYCPEVSVFHYWKRSAHNNWKYTAYFLRSAIRYFRKWGYRFF